MTTVAAAWVRRRWVFVLALAVAAAVALWAVLGALDDSEARRRRAVEAAQDRRRIEALVLAMGAQQEVLLDVAQAIEDATSPAAQARGAAATARAVADLRREAVCAALYVAGERPPACEGVAVRMDRILAGEDPFAAPAPALPPSSTGEDA